MSQWGLAQRVEDAMWFIEQVVKPKSKQPVYIGGLTGGGMAAIATVNRYPDQFDGIFSTGALYSNDINTQIHNMQSCDDFKARLDQGQVSMDVLAEFIPVVQLAQMQPEQASPIIPGATNLQALVTILGVPGFLGKNALSPNYVYALANADQTQFEHIDTQLFFDNFATFGQIASVQHHIDISCAFTGERTFTDNLQAFTGDVLLLGGQFGMLPMLEDTGALFEQANVQYKAVPLNGGEADNYLLPFKQRKQALDRPIIRWIKGAQK